MLDVVSRSRAAIGIFGTQRRELISRPTVDRLIERLDTWFARYEDDVLMYGRGRNNVVHIGDWLIDQFPLTRAVNDEPLVISNELGQELALDRAIHTIQQHKQVTRQNRRRCFALCLWRSLWLMRQFRRGNPISRPANFAVC